MTQVEQLTAQEVCHQLAKNTAILIDIRTPEEYQAVHIAQATLIPLATLANTSISAETDQMVVFHCKLGGRTELASPLFASLGLPKVSVMVGGIEAWIQAGFPVEHA